MTILTVGLTHRTAPGDLLERLAVPRTQLAAVLSRLRAVPAIDEVVLLSTCNRVEVYAATRGAVETVSRAIAELLADHAGLPLERISRTAAVSVDAAAVEHLFAVACGLDSMAVGEEQIVAQIRTAARSAAEAGTTGPVVTRLVDAALRVSKRARTQTTISTAGISLARAGLELAATHLDGLAGRRAIVVGTGSVARLTARLLREAGVARLSVASRTDARAAELAVAVSGTPLRTDSVISALDDADLLVTATGSTRPVVLADQVRAVQAQTGDRPLFVLDLGLPPDVERDVGRLSGVTLVDIPALGRHLADHEAPKDVARARAIVAEEVAAFTLRQDQTEAAPFIAAMHAHVRQLAEDELRRLHGRLPDQSPQHQAETASTIYRILRKFLHGPTVQARRMSTDPEGARQLDALRRLFELNVTDAA
jgi:glutamyl-tRNA reductase